MEEIGGKAKVGGGGVEAGSEDQEAGPGSRGGAGGKRGREEDEGAVVARSLKGDWEEGGDERDGDHGAKRRSDAGDGCSKKAKNIPAHRGAFKRHLRKHTFLFQREGGKIPKGFIVTCVQVPLPFPLTVSHAAAIRSRSLTDVKRRSRDRRPGQSTAAQSS